MGRVLEDFDTAVPIIIRPAYLIRLQALTIEGQTLRFVTGHITQWSKAICRQLRADWDTFMSLQDGPIYSIVELDNKKHRQFLNATGFEYLGFFKGTDNVIRNLFAHKGYRKNV